MKLHTYQWIVQSTPSKNPCIFFLAPPANLQKNPLNTHQKWLNCSKNSPSRPDHHLDREKEGEPGPMGSDGCKVGPQEKP